MDFLNKLKDKKNTDMSPQYKSAKMSTLQALRDEMSGMMKDDLSNAKGMKKVEVAGSDPHALAAGLDKAKELVAGQGDDDSVQPDDAAGLIKELVDHEASEGDLTADGIDELIKMLEQKKMELGSKDKEMTPALDKMTGQGE